MPLTTRAHPVQPVLRAGVASALCVVLCMLIAAGASAQVRTAFPAERGLSARDFPRVIELSPGVYGYEALREPGFTTVSLFVVGERGVPLADGQGDPAAMQRLLGAGVPRCAQRGDSRSAPPATAWAQRRASSGAGALGGVCDLDARRLAGDRRLAAGVRRGRMSERSSRARALRHRRWLGRRAREAPARRAPTREITPPRPPARSNENSAAPACARRRARGRRCSPP